MIEARDGERFAVGEEVGQPVKKQQLPDMEGAKADRQTAEGREGLRSR